MVARATGGRTIAIVGAGFSGSSLAVALLRTPLHIPLHVLLIDPADVAGPGLAYRAGGIDRLNVCAAQLSADAQQPDEFLQFARSRGFVVCGDEFLPRELYGQYLLERLQSARRAAQDSGSQLSILQASATSLRRTSPDAGWRLTLSDGRRLGADEVVLALGNPPPSVPREFMAFTDSPSYVNDPWNDAGTRCAGERVLLLGTGLTACDVAARMFGRPAPPTAVHALSRHGLLPTSHAPLAATPRHAATVAEHTTNASRPSTLARDVETHSADLHALTKTLRRHATDALARGGDWRNMLADLRSLTPSIWRRLDAGQRGRFLRHLRTYWDIHRHRLPPATAAEIADLRNRRQLQLHAGRIIGVHAEDAALKVQWRARGGGSVETLHVDRVINCTGPNYDLLRSSDPLVQQLLGAGLVSADPLRLGLRTLAAGRVVSAGGGAVSNLYYCGPMLRERAWEATAVPELRVHVATLADELTTAWRADARTGARRAVS